ncbi:MAG TPA: OsmC family protein [Clostridia bacterium]|nr:OsmC family protein [Clostridia bacterium]
MENIVVELKRTKGNVHFETVSADHPAIPVPFDYTPPLGLGEGLAGLEALVMTFSGCVSTAVVGLLLRLGKHVVEYSVRAEGERNEQPLSLKKIMFHVQVASADVTPEDMDKVMHQAELISPVWIAIRGNVAVETSYQIN